MNSLCSKMPKTYCKIHLQVIFAVKYRQAMIEKRWSQELFSVIAQLFKEAGASALIVNGVSDHVHCLIRMNPKVALSEVMKSVKAKSSLYVNNHGLTPSRFEWQIGYAAFAYHFDQVERVRMYIENQESHHGMHSFPQEYLSLLKEHEVEFEVDSLFRDPE
jgi:putative transposase